MTAQTQGITAWIGTWDGTGAHVKVDSTEVVGFFGPTAHIDYVRQQVEWMYAEKNYTLEERIAWTKDPSKNPYKGTIEGDFVHCGHNPFLKARIVDNLVLQQDKKTRKVTGTWTERKKP